MTTYELHRKQQHDIMERNKQKLDPPKYTENLIRFPKYTAGYQIADSSEYADANGLKRFFIGVAAVLIALSILNYFLPGISFEDIFVKGGRP